MFYFFYYFPLGLDVRPRREVWATWAILGACVAGFLVQRFAPLLFWANYEAFVFVPAAPSPSSFVLNAYVHGGWLHLVSNMISLAVFGAPLEERIGAKRFLLLYHVANIMANVFQGAVIHVWMPQLASAGVLGASGAISGLMGLFVLRLHFARLRLGYWAFLPLQAYTRCGTAFVPVGFAVAVWFLIQLGLALVQLGGAAAGVAVGSHLGGLAAGMGLGTLLHLRRAAAAEQNLHRGRRYLDRAAWFAAQGEFIEYVRRQPQDEEGHLELARTYRLTGRQILADQHYRQACHLLAAAKRFDRVEEVYVEAEKGSPTFTLAAAPQLQLAQLLERSLKRSQAATAYARFANRHPEDASASLALYRAARLSAQLPDLAWQAPTLFVRLVEHYPYSAEAGLARTELRQFEAAA